jgi:SAM-dependent methyltransferase
LECRAFNERSVNLEKPVLAEAESRGLLNQDFSRAIVAGALLCCPCKTMFPVVNGLPVLLPYTTERHERSRAEFKSEFGKLEPAYRFPAAAPVQGEDFVRKSFSEEWEPYDYDGVLWEMSYEDDERRFLQEIGASCAKRDGTFLEVGCGLGITTNLARKNFGMDAVGVDLSSAVSKAAQQFSDDPFLHFAQASAFSLPFARACFDMVYSRGVLHHTYSTEAAFKAVANVCRPGGCAYLWVYGLGSINDNLFRRVAYALEQAARPTLSLHPNAAVSRMVLGTFAVGYIGFNAMRRMRDPLVQPLTFARAVHAARDRFTPRFAHRHSQSDVMRWFGDAGFDRIEAVDWRQVPSADREDFRRNVGVRGVKRFEKVA